MPSKRAATGRRVQREHRRPDLQQLHHATLRPPGPHAPYAQEDRRKFFWSSTWFDIDVLASGLLTVKRFDALTGKRALV